MRPVRLALPAFIVLLSLAGFLAANRAVDSARRDNASRRVARESIRTQAILARARAYVVGLSSALAGQRPGERQRFRALTGPAAATIGLPDVLWVTSSATGPRVPRVRFATGALGGAVPPGTDVSRWPGLGAALRTRESLFAVTATGPGTLRGRQGFFLLYGGQSALGAGGQGVLVVFVPMGWFTVLLENDPRRVAISLDGHPIDGRVTATPAATARFTALGNRWTVRAAADPPTGLAATLPWVALAWAPAAGLIALLVARGVMRRREAEREVERLFELSLDLLAVTGLDGYLRRVNPAFERTLGYPTAELLARPLIEFAHPEDRASSLAALQELQQGRDVVHFEARFVRSDGSVRWLEWNATPVPERRLVYNGARDVTERREAADELRRSQRLLEASRDDLRALADEQAALRRVATLVARGEAPRRVFDAVAGELAHLMRTDSMGLLRYCADSSGTWVATDGDVVGLALPGQRMLFEHSLLLQPVWETGEAHMADLTMADLKEGTAAAVLRELGFQTLLGVPIVVDGQLWGLAAGAWRRHVSELPPDTLQRLAQFTELVATAIANAEGRAELNASRARVVAASDQTRRRIERDLHDGTQQRLVALALGLRAAETRVPPEHGELRAALARSADGLTAVVADLQEISRGLHPSILSKGGLGPALKSLARRSAVAVELDADVPDRLPESVEVAAYYVVSEALTNAAKHAAASVVHVRAETDGDAVVVTVCDDGVGGAEPALGSGLVGLRDRVEAAGGTIELRSPRGHGTTLHARIPLEQEPLRAPR